MAANVRRLRRGLGTTQEALAEKVECAPRHLQRIEAGEVNLSLHMLVALAHALGVDARELLDPAAAAADSRMAAN